MIKEANIFLEMGVEKIVIFKQKELHSAVSAENSEICGGQDLSNRVVCQAFGIKAVQVKLMQRQRIITVLNIFPFKNSKKAFCRISTGLWMSQGHRQRVHAGSCEHTAFTDVQCHTGRKQFVCNYEEYLIFHILSKNYLYS